MVVRSKDTRWEEVKIDFLLDIYVLVKTELNNMIAFQYSNGSRHHRILWSSESSIDGYGFIRVY